VREEPRRAGDPPALIAQAKKVRDVLGWSPQLDDIDTIVRSQLDWERHMQREPW
jgi:UDP-glucose 4-epimerase